MRLSLNTNKHELNWIVAAGIVGADIGTSVFYGTGILFPIVGYLAPVFVLICCLMMWVFKRTYEEGLALSPYNGGAYSMILRTLGRQAAVLAGALTVVSYLATAAVSSLSGAFYLSSLSEGGTSTTTLVLLSFIPIILFALLNSRGIKEPAKIVTGIAGFHFFLLIIITIWGFGYLAFNLDEVDWTKFQRLTPSGEISMSMLLYGFGAAFLGITGFESAAQIVEELEEPVLKTVRKLYKTVIILVSLTAPTISFLCLVLLSEGEINNQLDSLLSGLSYKLGGKVLLYIIVVDATLTLFAATNTAFVGFIGLATTMAKQGNLPRILLYRLAHKYPSIQGYPFIAIPFMFIAMAMCAFVTGEVKILAKVYEIAFLGVMVSFCIGVVLMRNRELRKGIPSEYLSSLMLVTKKMNIPLIPLLSGFVLFIAQATLFAHSSGSARNMLMQLISMSLLLMAFYRWGVLEKRLETRTDLRLGAGRFASQSSLPSDLPKYVLCTGGTNARRLINASIRHIHKQNPKSPFELVVFHAENNKDPEGFFYELLQRVVSQQIVPTNRRDFIITVKILPGSLMEGLQTLKKTMDFDKLIFGTRSHTSEHPLAKSASSEIEKEYEIVYY